MPKDKKTKNTSEKRGKRATQNAETSARNGGSAERPPESAEDFGHVLRRLMVARAARSEREENVRPGR